MAQVDASIALQGRPFTLESPLAQAGQAMSLQNLIQQGEMNRVKAQQAREAAAREQEYRTAIANAKTPEEQLAVASRFMGADKLAPMIQGSQDRQSRDKATREMAMARLTQAAQQFEMNYQARLRTVTNQEERLALDRQRAAFIQGIQGEAQRLAGAEAQYNFGFVPSAPTQPTVSPQGPAMAPQGPSAPMQQQAPPTAPPMQPASTGLPPQLANSQDYMSAPPQNQQAMRTLADLMQRGGQGSVGANNPGVVIPPQGTQPPMSLAAMATQTQPPPLAAGQPLIPREAVVGQPAPATPTAPAEKRRYTLADAPAELPMRAKVAWLAAREAEFAKATAAVTGGGKALTEGQGKAILYGTRAAQSDKILKTLEDKISLPGLAAARMLGTAGNYIMSSEQQRVDQAQRDFVNAVLRQESGAVISDAEFANAQRQYFPTPGDDAKTIEQKRANRQTAITGFSRMAGPGSADIDAINKTGTTAPRQIKTDAEYNALPSGAEYIAPDGSTRKKK